MENLEEGLKYNELITCMRVCVCALNLVNGHHSYKYYIYLHVKDHHIRKLYKSYKYTYVPTLHKLW